MYRKSFILATFVLLIIIGIIVAIVFTIDDDTGDFNIKYVGNAKKYETFIKQGVNRWSSIGTGGVYVEVRTSPTLSGNTAAQTYGNTVTISESVFNRSSTNIKILIIAHEVGHVLGIGTWNKNTQVLTDGTQKYLSNSKYPRTAKAYVDKVRPAGVTLVGAPIENGGHGEGSDLVHWEDNPIYGMQKDIMTYSIKSHANIISIVDLTFLDEIGKTVDLSQAQSLKGTLSSVIGEYVFGDEETEYTCGTCEKCKEQ